MRELPEKREVYAPATLVYLPSPSARAEDFFTLSNSNGLAAGPRLEFAVLHGLYGLIERDGFLLNWMNRLPAPGVDFSASAEWPTPCACTTHATARRFVFSTSAQTCPPMP